MLGTLSLLFDFTGTSGFLGNGARLPSNWIAPARRIDMLLVNPPAALTPGSFGAAAPPADPLVANLAFRNLGHANMLRLATGQGMVTFLDDHGVPGTGVGALATRELRAPGLGSASANIDVHAVDADDQCRCDRIAAYAGLSASVPSRDWLPGPRSAGRRAGLGVS